MNPVAGRPRGALALTAATLAGALILSGCATTQPAPMAAPAPSATPVARGAAPVPVTAGRAMQPRPVALRDERSLRALDPTGIERLIGHPTFVRQDGGATVWQYTARSCIVDLFWYRSEIGPALVHMEARNIHSPRAADMQGCLDELWSQHAVEAES